LKHSLYLILFLGLLTTEVYGQGFLVEKDLKLDWTFYDEKEQNTLPFLDNNSNAPFAIHLNVAMNFGRETYLLLEIPANTSLFIENRFMVHYPVKSNKYFSLDSLKSTLTQENLYLTLFRNDGFDAPPASSIGYLHQTFDRAMNVNPINTRNMDRKSDYLKVIILIIFTFFVIVHSLFPTELLDFYSLSSLVTFRFTDTYLTKFRNITKIQTLVIVFQAAMLSGVMIISLHYYNNPLGDSFIMASNPLWGWLVVFAITLTLIFLKYALISIMSHLFGMTDRINFYFIEYLRMAMIFYTAIFIALSYVVINHFYSLSSILNTVIIIVIVFNFVRLIIIYFKFHGNMSIKNLHLFSYLCSTELIPIVIGLNFFIK